MVERIICADALDGLRQLETGSVDMCVTSPPYYGLRDYGTAQWANGNPECDHIVGEIRTGLGLADSAVSIRGGGHKLKAINKIQAKAQCPKCGAVRIDKQIGLEETPEEYIVKLVGVFREVWRVLRDDGTLWVNIGDSYATKSGPQPPGNTRNKCGHTEKSVPKGYKCKDLIGIPWMLAFALRADGWYLRQDIIWAKPNCLPESVTDRCTKSHEYIFLLSKSGRYFFNHNAVKEPAGEKGNSKTFRGGGAYTQGKAFNNGNIFERESSGNILNATGMRNKRDVWSVATRPYPCAHFATFPPELIRPCILAGSRCGGIVLDPFFGAGTTGLVAIEEQRGYIGIELNPAYIKIAEERLKNILKERVI